MEENIVSVIANAEEQAAARKAQASARASVIAATTESELSAIAQRSEISCREYRAEALKAAEEEAEKNYVRALEESRAAARAYADECLEHVDGVVAEIVGRLIK